MDGKSIISIAEQFKGDRYILGALPFRNNEQYLEDYRDNGIPFDRSKIKGPFDCAEFVSIVIFIVLKKLYGANNNNAKDLKTVDCWTNFFKRDFDNGLFRQITIKEAANTPGAIVLRFTKNSRIGHIAFCIGDGKSTIEAHSSRYGIINSTVNNRTWDCAFVLNEITTKQIGSVNINYSPKVYRLTKPFMRGDKVKEIAIALEKAGYKTNGTDKDGIYGPGMFRAVHTYQKDKGLVIDGMVGPETAASLGVSF